MKYWRCEKQKVLRIVDTSFISGKQWAQLNLGRNIATAKMQEKLWHISYV
jgi:hypothetical protein